MVVGQRGGAAHHAALNLAVVGEDVLVAAVGEDMFPGTREEIGRLRGDVSVKRAYIKFVKWK